MNRVEWIQERKVEWLGGVGLGALTNDNNLYAKTLLAAWNSTDGKNWINQYGFQPTDMQPAWGSRDGWVLAGFSKWWNGSNVPKLSEGTIQGGVLWADLTLAHLKALKSWQQNYNGPPPAIPQCAQNCQSKWPNDPVNLATCLSICSGSPVPIPTPEPPGYAQCAQNCVSTYGLDPIGVAECLKACAVPLPPLPTLPPVQPPLPPPPSQPPLPPPLEPISSSSSGSNVGLWVIGTLAALGVGALLISGGKPVSGT